MPNRINDAIRGVKEVRLVGDNVEQGVYSFETAIRMADDMNLDLVEISPNAVPWLTLPSNGFWGDIGYVTFRVNKTEKLKTAVAELHLKDFHLHGLDPAASRPAAWDARFNDLKGSRCTFVI